MDSDIVIGVSHTYKGKFLKMNINVEVESATQRLLNTVGEQAAEEMKSHTRQHDWRNRLTDGISWVTQSNRGGLGSAALDSDALPKPDNPHSVDIGTQNPYAIYRELGAGPHINSEGSEEFINNMKEWFRDKIGQDPEDNGEGQFFFWNIIRKIREGQDAVPFALPSLPALMAIAKTESARYGFGRLFK